MDKPKQTNPAKKPIKRPIVRQTKTSLFRTLQANPLLVIEPDKYKNIDIAVDKLPKSITDLGSNFLFPKTSFNKSNMSFLQDKDFERPSSSYERGLNKFPLNKVSKASFLDDHQKVRNNSILNSSMQKHFPVNHVSDNNQLSNKHNLKHSNHALTVNRNRALTTTKPIVSSNKILNAGSSGVAQRNGVTSNKAPKSLTITSVARFKPSTSFKSIGSNIQSQNVNKSKMLPAGTVTKHNTQRPPLTKQLSLNKSLPATPTLPVENPKSELFLVEENKTKRRQSRRTWGSPVTPKLILPRRSASAEGFDVKRLGLHIVPEESVTLSMTDITDLLEIEDESLKKESPPEEFVFKTPVAYRRRSTKILTPSTVGSNMFPKKSSTPAQDLELNDWLHKNGESVSKYKALKLFDEEDKENVGDENARDDTLNTLEEENSAVVLSALEKVYKLILDGYSLEKCDIWLSKIHEKNPNIHKQSLFWECKAGIERERGNFSTAIECYRTAITNGAEIETVDQSLEQLLKKFQVLDIETPEKVLDKNTRRKVVHDARQVFKSSIIQFALKEKSQLKIKEKEIAEKEYLAMPVRRTTRKSRYRFSSTPGLKICSSLTEVDESIRKSMSFQSNDSLLV